MSGAGDPTGPVDPALPADAAGPASLLKGLSILDALMAAGPAGLGHVELSRRLGVQRSTLYRHLGVLVDLGYIERVASSHRYRLGPTCVVLGAAAQQERMFPRIARPFVAELAHVTGNTAHATIFHDNHAFTVELSGPQSQIGSCVAVGSRRPAHRSASGRVFLAHAFDRIHKGGRPDDTAQPAMSPAQMDTIRRRKYALDQGEFISGVSCIAAPVFDATGAVAGALSISVAADSLDSEAVHRLRQPLLAITRRFSERMGRKS